MVRIKTLQIKYQGWEPIHQKYKANENTSRHKPKGKKTQTIIKKSCKNLMQRKVKAMK
jgi:hypothetical protein